MVSVTNRIKQIKQPRGGFIKPKNFTVIDLKDGKDLCLFENIHSSLVGMAVDYLTRIQMGTPPQAAFTISLRGAEIVKRQRHAEELLKGISGLDDGSIINACQLCGYDVVVRAGAHVYNPEISISPDPDTISNIRVMVERGISFIQQYGPVIKDGFTFLGGYTDTITSGDGDFLTNDTLWDFKVSKKGPTPQHTLQLLIYYLMGEKSIFPYFTHIENIGFFNPRLNIVYVLAISEIPIDTISQVQTEVIGYKPE
jgi:hypothetical protein